MLYIHITLLFDPILDIGLWPKDFFHTKCIWYEKTRLLSQELKGSNFSCMPN